AAPTLPTSIREADPAPEVVSSDTIGETRIAQAAVMHSNPAITAAMPPTACLSRGERKARRIITDYFPNAGLAGVSLLAAPMATSPRLAKLAPETKLALSRTNQWSLKRKRAGQPGPPRAQFC